MKLERIVEDLDLEVKTGAERLGENVVRGYVSDLMSDVIANANKGDLWVTLQVHINIVAVASMKELSGIILINGRQPTPDTLKKAQIENIPVFVSRLPAFEIVGRLYQLGISGTADA